MTASGESIISIKEELGLIERHVIILKVVFENQPIGLIRLSEITDFPKHKVRYSLKLLEKEGIISATPEGAMVTDKMESFMESMKEHLNDMIVEIEQIKMLL